MVDPNDDPIQLVPSRDEEWRGLANEEADRVRNALERRSLAESVVRIEHVGSTAVPELAAKDIVDLDVVVRDDAVAKVSSALESTLGGTVVENHFGWHPLFRSADGQRFNDHVFAVSDDGWKKSVVTRDVLRERPALRGEYERLKRELSDGTGDLTEYSVGKTEFLQGLLSMAAKTEDRSFEFQIPTE